MEVRVLARRGAKVKQIARELGISKNTVKRYLRDPQAGRYGPRAPRPRKLDAHLEYLQERIEAARPRWIPATVLLREIRNRGYGPTVREIGSQFGIRSPNGVMCHLKALERKGLITRESHMSRAIQLSESPQDRMSLPLAGQIAAGSPMLAVEQSERIDFSPLFDSEDHFCLKVKGDSMVEDQIADGDTGYTAGFRGGRFTGVSAGA